MSVSTRKVEVEIAVVGAGLSGLAAAKLIHDADVSFIVVEARDRVGGRTLTLPVGPNPDSVIDLGAQWSTSRQERIGSVASELGIERVDCSNHGEDVLVVDGRRDVLNSAPSPEIAETIGVLDSMAEQVPVEAPWAASEAKSWDAISLGSWLASRVASPEARSSISAAAEDYFAVSSAEIPLLHALFYARANWGFDYLIGDKGDPASQKVFSGGAQQLSEGLAGQFLDRIMLSAAVVGIDQESAGVELRGNDFQISAERAIIAIPPALAGRIIHEPALPPERDQLTQRFPMGSGWKMHLMFEQPFWKEDGFSGRAMDVDSGVSFFDTTPQSGEPGVLTVLPSIPKSWSLVNLTAEIRKQTVVQAAAGCFGSKASSPMDYWEFLWANEKWSRGDVAVPTLGTWSSFGKALRQPFGRLHWAGTETATVSPGQMEGAIRAGERAALEALLLL